MARARARRPVTSTPTPGGPPEPAKRGCAGGRGRGAGASRRHRAVWQFRGAPAPAAPAIRPNVLLITLDTTRADRLGSYGYAAAATPNLDRLAAARRALRSRAVVGAPDAAVARQPHDRPPSVYPWRAEQRPLHAGRGRADAGGRVRRPPGTTRRPSSAPSCWTGSSAWRAGSRTTTMRWTRRRRRIHVARAGTSRRSHGGRGVGVARVARVTRGHEPLLPVGPSLRPARPLRAAVAVPRTASPAAPYDGEIAFDDALVGALLDRAPASASATTMVVVAGDHGESLGDHGESTHGLFVYEPALRVPLIMAGPGIAAVGRARAGPADRRRADDCSTSPAWRRYRPPTAAACAPLMTAGGAE